MNTHNPRAADHKSESVTWGDYLRAIASPDSGNEIARKTGYAASTISRWLRDLNRPEPAQVEKVARVYGVPAIDALAAAGYLVGTPELALVGPSPRLLQLKEFSAREIFAESVRRIEEARGCAECSDNQHEPHTFW